MGIRIGIGSLKIGQGSTGVDWSSYWTTQPYKNAWIGAYPRPVSPALETPKWYVDSAATGTGTGEDWTNAFITIGAAITAASDGDVIEVSGGTEGKMYSENPDITKAVTIQGSKTTGHSATATIDGQIGSHNTSGTIKVINFKKIVTNDLVYPILTYADSSIEYYDIYFGPQLANNRYPRLDGGTAKFFRCTFNRTLNIGNSASYVITYQSASIAEFEYCFFDHAGVVYLMPASSTIKLNHCTVLSDGMTTLSFIDAGNSATITVEVTNSVFFGIHPIKSGSSSKSPVVTNVFWHKTPTTTGYTTFDSSNKATITNAITAVDPLFTAPKNTLMGDVCIRIDDRNNLPDSENACAVFNPEIKLTHYVDLHSFHSTTRPSAAEIDIMRRLIAAGNEVGGHGSTHSDLNGLDCITISATGTTPTLDIVVTQAGDSSTWTGTLSVTINSIKEDFDLLTYNTLNALITALNGASIGDGVVTAAKVGTVNSDYLFMGCLAGVTAESISAEYTILLDDTAFNRFEVTECILDLETYINDATDRNGNNAIAGTTEDAPSPAYVCKTYSTAYGNGRASVLALLKANANIIGASGANGVLFNNGKLYNYGVGLDLYTFPYNQAPNDASMFAIACNCASGPFGRMALYHGSPTYGGTVAGYKALMQMFGLGTKTFKELIDYIRTDGGWTVTDGVAAFTGDYEDYMSKGDYTLLPTSPLWLD